MQPGSIDESDLQLLHLLQIAPRISWANAAEVLKLSPSAVAGRWRRLRADGLAWVTVHPNEAGSDHVSAFVDVDRRPDGHDQIVKQLGRDPRVVSLDRCLWGRDLMLTVMVRDLASLSAFVLDELPAIPGITAVRARVATEVYADGTDWRLDALDGAQRARATASAPAPSGRRTLSRSPSEEWPLIEALTHDARLPVAELARFSHGNPATVRRHLERLIAAEVLSFRCDLAYQSLGWPVTCSWLARIPPGEIDQTVFELKSHAQLRLCAAMAGDGNLGFTVLARTVQGIGRFEQALGKRLERLRLLESMIHVRPLKRMGWLLHDDGRCTGEVVVPSVFQPPDPSGEQDHPPHDG